MKPPPFLKNPNLELEISGEALKNYMSDVVARVAEFYDSLPSQSTVKEESPLGLRKLIQEPLPEKPETFEKIIKTIFDDCLPVGINLPSPGYLAYIPVGSMGQTAIAEFISNAINRWPALYRFCPGFIEIEKVVLRWLCEIVGLPETSGGILTSGGSLANFSAVYTARVDKLPENFWNGTIYCSDQSHLSVFKAARMAGFPTASLRVVETDSDFRIQIPQLERLIEEDIQKGKTPFLLIGIAGTTNTGSVDDLKGLSAVAKKHSLWFHVDAAWGGGFHLTQHGKKLMEGIESADSVTIDPHKALYTSFGAGALLVRDPVTLAKAHHINAEYLPQETGNQDEVNFSEIGPELSRTLRGLQVWLPMKLHGIRPFIDNFEEKLELTRWAAREIESTPNLKLVMKPQLSLVTFTYKNEGLPADKISEINRRILSAVNKDGRLLLSGTTLKGTFICRIVPFGNRTHFETVKEAIDKIRAEVLNIAG